MLVKSKTGSPVNDGTKIHQAGVPFEMDDAEAQKMIDDGTLIPADPDEETSPAGATWNRISIEDGIAKLRKLAEEIGVANIKKLSASELVKAINAMAEKIGSVIPEMEARLIGLKNDIEAKQQEINELTVSNEELSKRIAEDRLQNLRLKAEAAGIEGFNTMSEDELVKALGE